MILLEAYKAKRMGLISSDSLFAAVAGTKLNKDAWKKGFNKWDEEWELGKLNTSTGADADSTTQIRSINYVPIIGGIAYWVTANPAVWCVFFNENKEAINSEADFHYNKSNNAVQLGSNTLPFTPPDAARYMRFYTQNAYGTTYNDDICINISGEHDGEYVPYNG